MPLRSVEYAVRFAASLSAWWLLPLIPLVVLLAMAIYRSQSRAVSQGHSWGLNALRAILMAFMVFLAFRPSLVRRETTTYPGRLLFLVDDSASMSIPDPALPEDLALTVARHALDSFAGREAPAADLRKNILELERMLFRFEHYGRGADRTQDTFWGETERAQVKVNELLVQAAERATDLANGASNPEKLRHVAGRCRDLQSLLTPLFSGHQAPGDDFRRKMRASLSELVELLDEAQIAAEKAAMEAGDSAPTEAIKTVRRTPRLDLAYAWLNRNRDTITENMKGFGLWMQPLSQEKPIPFSDLASQPPPISTLETDLSGVLLKCIEAEHDFPLAGIVVISDGRNLGETSIEEVSQAAALHSVPIFTAGIGSLEEPADVAVREIHHAPFAVSGTPFGAHTFLKTVLPKPQKAELELLSSGQSVVANETLKIDKDQQMDSWLLFTPEGEGLQRLTVRTNQFEGEVVPKQNNSLDLTVRIRSEPVRVLFLDYKPRWQSRFVLNILNRLGYLEINPIIVLAQPEGILKRDVGKGSWPQDAGTLALYDLVILGDLPAKMLTDAEWKQLADYVKDGKSLALLGTETRDPIPPALARELLPIQPRTAPTALAASTVTLQLTTAGRSHPVTRSLRQVIQTAKSVATDRREDDTIGLLQASDGRLLISTRFVGKGKTILVDTDRLWRRLNATALEAHAGLVAGLADWAIEADVPKANEPRPGLCRYTNRESVQVWTQANESANPVVELRAGEQMLEAPAVPAHPGSKWAAAVFEHVPQGDWSVKLRDGGAAPEPILVVDRSRELHDLSRGESWLKTLAKSAGGAYSEFVESERLLNHIQPRNRVEHREHVWRLWDNTWVLGLLIVMLAFEWSWRKLAGLV